VPGARRAFASPASHQAPSARGSGASAAIRAAQDGSLDGRSGVGQRPGGRARKHRGHQDGRGEEPPRHDEHACRWCQVPAADGFADRPLPRRYRIGAYWSSFARLRMSEERQLDLPVQRATFGPAPSDVPSRCPVERQQEVAPGATLKLRLRE
jgi:hypothetical protein